MFLFATLNHGTHVFSYSDYGKFITVLLQDIWNHTKSRIKINYKHFYYKMHQIKKVKTNKDWKNWNYKNYLNNIRKKRENINIY